MSFYPPHPTLSRRFRLVHASFLQGDGLPFADALPAERIEEICVEAGVQFPEDEEAVYTPAVTLWAMLSQTLAKGELRSCAMAVSRVIVLLVALGREPCSRNTGAYCRARARLPEVVLRRLTVEVGTRCEAALPGKWLWHGRHVVLGDGATVSMADTEANQQEYPQKPSQAEGLGFPLARLLVLLSLASGLLHDMALGPYAGKETGELALLRELLGRLDPGTILLTDRYFCSYFMIALLLLGQRDFVARLHHRRKTDYATAKSLGKGDWLVRWLRPTRPDWMDPEQYATMPESIEVRLVEFPVCEPGFRPRRISVVTTLTDASEYPKDDIASLYRQRWLVELDIRAIKTTMGMDVVRAKTPSMVRREIWSCLLAYNLIRKSILQSAHHTGRSPRELSFAAALQMTAATWEVQAVLEVAGHLDADLGSRLALAHLTSLATLRVGHRPNRVEPRAVKRRPKPHKLLTKPRRQAIAELKAGQAMLV